MPEIWSLRNSVLDIESGCTGGEAVTTGVRTGVPSGVPTAVGVPIEFVLASVAWFSGSQREIGVPDAGN